MLVLKFDIFGKYAFFKNPEINEPEISYPHIHKPVVMGIIGCILGFNGKAQITKDNPIPEYYTNLKNIKISIVPSKPVFRQFKESITNTVGYANAGNTQIIERIILQDVRWTIYIQKDGIEEYWEKLCDMLQKHESTYPLFLGNNSYKAKVDNFKIIELEQVNLIEIEGININSIYKKEIIEEETDIVEEKMPYYVQMYYPMDIDNLTLYKKEWFIISNLITIIKENVVLYKDNNVILSFI